jgi:hypothetical protein
VVRFAAVGKLTAICILHINIASKTRRSAAWKASARASRNGLERRENNVSIVDIFIAKSRSTRQRCWQKASARATFRLMPKVLARILEAVET